MRNMYFSRVLLAVTILFFGANHLMAQEPVANTKDGKVVFLESTLNELPAKRAEYLRNKKNVIIISSRSELKKVERKHGLKNEVEMNSSYRESEVVEGKKASLEIENREDAVKLYEQGEISKSDYEKILEKRGFSKDEVKKRSKKKVNGEYPVRPNRANDRAKGSITENRGVDDDEQYLSEETTKDALEAERERLLRLYNEGKITKEEVNALMEKKKRALRNYGSKMEDAPSKDLGKSNAINENAKTEKQKYSDADNMNSDEKVSSDYPSSDNAKELNREEERELLKKKGYSDEDIQEFLDQKYGDR